MEGARKIAAMGIHLRRHVATLGVALNLTVPTSGPPEENPWARFVPCGIEGRGVTSVEAELGDKSAQAAQKGLLDGETVARHWGDEFARRLERGEVTSGLGQTDGMGGVPPELTSFTAYDMYANPIHWPV